MTDPLHGIEEDVQFDDATANRLISLAKGSASTIESQVGSRSSWVSTGLTDFEGHFADLFRTNAATAARDAGELSRALTDLAGQAGYLMQAAHAEQKRRETARKWKQEQDHRSGLHKAWDAVFGEDKPPVGPPDPPPYKDVSAPPPGRRQTPSPGSGGGGGGGTSSARPDHLRSFARGSRGANQELSGKPGQLHTALAEFAAKCKWGTLSADSVVSGFHQWLAANEEDVRWAELVANAFAAAGGDHAVSTVSNSALAATLRAHGVDLTRDDITIDPPTAFGVHPTTGYSEDPVNTATGNFIEVEDDLVFVGAAADLSLVRTYNSFNPEVGAFGRGWSSIADAGLSFTDEAARFRRADGAVVVFPRLGEGWDRASGGSLWLTRVGEGLRISGNDGAWWEFSAEGVLSSFGTGLHNVVRLVREGRRLVGLEHSRGRSIELSWDGDRVVSARSSDGRTVEYTYDSREGGGGRLIAATGPGGTRFYRWDEQDLVVAVVDADGVVEAENVYDEHARIVQQRSPLGRVSRFVYLPGRVTAVSDEDGSRSNTWIADEHGRLVGVVDSEERRQSMSYDAAGNLVMVTERDGSTTVNEYDERGRRVRTVTPTGAELTWGYDDLDRVTMLVSEAGAVTEFGYEGEERNPATILDPEGGLTRLRWEDGLLREVVDPVGVVVRFDYDEYGDLAATIDAEGNAARLERDEAGRVIAAVTPLGHRTTYSYDPVSGLLAQRRNPDGGVWRYEYTEAGRLRAVIDPTGARTEIEHGIHGEEIRTIDPLGRAVTRTLDDLGNLASVELPDGSTWRFGHDALSRLTWATTPSGETSRLEYDANGALVATVDPTGVREAADIDVAGGRVEVSDGLASSSARFDPLGRLVSAEQPDGSASVTTYDRCGRPVEVLDPEGGLTLIRRDAAGRVVEVVSPLGAVTGYEYDACGRLAAVVDPAGARTTFDYDADGRLVRRTLPTGEVAWTEYDACGRVTARFTPGRGVARYVYDAAGRVTQASDTWYGRRRFRYDAAGQLVEAVNGAGGVTRWTYDANGRAVAITDPLGGVTRREYDAQNHCIAETDPLGRTTRAGYDAAGRQIWQEDPTGRRTTWTYDAHGRLESVGVDGTTTSSIVRDLRNRSVRILDRTGEGEPLVHELEWNRRGQLVRRTRDGRSVTWAYDADGRRVAMTTPGEVRTDYGYDLAGRIISVDHPLLGHAAFDYDASGRIVNAVAGGIIQSWDYAEGWVVAHTLTDADGASRTRIERDPDGRITALDRDGVTTTYAYDQACQLIEARLQTNPDGSDGPDGPGGSGSSVTTWRYDAAGRLVAESIDGVRIEHTYDAAGQLLTTTESGGGSTGRRLSYSYDELGRRTRVLDSRGGSRDYAWSPQGWLSTIVDHVVDQAVERGDDRPADRVQRTMLRMDALGELATVDDTEVFWDTAAYAGSPVWAGGTSVLAAGPVTGAGSQWTAAGWRTARATEPGSDPWTLGSLAVGQDLPGGLSLGSSGELSVAGLEWMGARVYDPASRGFLSVDPLDPVPGAGWAGNPYSFAGNDPLHALDPLGLKPATDADLKAYAAAHAGGLHAAVSATGHWLKNNWEYVAGGAAIVAGGVLIATGVGGPAGMMLISAGADTIIQKATTGHVNWGEVAISGAMGAWGAEGAAVRLGASSALSKAVVGGVISGASSGGVGGAYTYATGPGPHTVGGFVDATTTGAAYGGVTGGVFGAAGHDLAPAANQEIRNLTSKELADIHPTPHIETPTPDVAPTSKELAPYWPANRGALGDWHDNYLYAGERIDRYGYPGGTFVAPEGTPYSMRALPPGSDAKPYHIYEVVKPIPVKTSTVAPAFGESGLGQQHELPLSVEKLTRHGILREIK